MATNKPCDAKCHKQRRVAIAWSIFPCIQMHTHCIFRPEWNRVRGRLRVCGLKRRPRKSHSWLPLLEYEATHFSHWRRSRPPKTRDKKPGTRIRFCMWVASESAAVQKRRLCSWSWFTERSSSDRWPTREILAKSSSDALNRGPQENSCDP